VLKIIIQRIPPFLSPWILEFLSSYSFLFDIYQTIWYNTPRSEGFQKQGYLTTKEGTTGWAKILVYPVIPSKKPVNPVKKLQTTNYKLRTTN
jgi:hypothetical protein